METVDVDELPTGLLWTDTTDRIVAANRWIERWAGRALVGERLSDVLVPGHDFLEIEGGLAVMMSAPAAPGRAVLVVRADQDGGAVLSIMDASDRYRAGQQLRASHALSDRTRIRLQLVIDASIAFADATNEERLAEILAVTTARAYGAEESAVLLLDDNGLRRAAGSNPFEELIDAETLTDATRRLSRVLQISGTAEAEALSSLLASAMTRTGVDAVIAAPLQKYDQNFGVFVCFFRHPRTFDEEAAPLAEALATQAAQVLATLRLQRRLEYAAMHDETTGLPNRRHLDQRGPTWGDVIFIDLDGFKSVNDRFGHALGDEVLREVARRLRTSVRDGDIVARYGGDEFVVICGEGGRNAAAEIAERLRLAVEAPYAFLPEDLRLGASIGLAPCGGSPSTVPIDMLIRRADQAMYAAKIAGGNRVALSQDPGLGGDRRT